MIADPQEFDAQQAAADAADAAFEERLARLEVKALDVLEEHLDARELNAVRVLLAFRSGTLDVDEPEDETPDCFQVSFLDQ